MRWIVFANSCWSAESPLRRILKYWSFVASRWLTRGLRANQPWTIARWLRLMGAHRGFFLFRSSLPASRITHLFRETDIMGEGNACYSVLALWCWRHWPHGRTSTYRAVQRNKLSYAERLRCGKQDVVLLTEPAVPSSIRRTSKTLGNLVPNNAWAFFMVTWRFASFKIFGRAISKRTHQGKVHDRSTTAFSCQTRHFCIERYQIARWEAWAQLYALLSRTVNILFKHKAVCVLVAFQLGAWIVGYHVLLIRWANYCS